jgi:hypothetical protein
MRKVVLAAKEKVKVKTKAELIQEEKEAIVIHKKAIARFKKANLNIVKDDLPEIGQDDYGKSCVFSGEIVLRGKTDSYSVNTPDLNSIAKWSKKTSWVFNTFKGTPDEVIKNLINGLTSIGAVIKMDPELLSKERGIIKCLATAADANVKSTNVARLTYRSKSQSGKLLWIAVQAPSDMTDMEGGAIRDADAKACGVTLQQILEYLIIKDAKKPKKQKRSTGHFIYD